MDSPFKSTTDESEDIITDWEPFDDDYTPDKILERDAIIEQYRRHLQPVLSGGRLHNVFIRGPTGVGKTAITKRMLMYLKQDAEENDVKFDYSYLNVKAKSSYESLLELANELSTRNFAEGTNTSRLRSEIYDAIDDIGGYYILAIDECDKLDEDGEDAFLYEFPRARSNGRVTDTVIGVIGISNNLTYGKNLDPRIKSSLVEREIEYAPYNAAELTAILNYYCEVALRDESYTDGALNFIAAKTATDSGDARMALDLLELAVEVAEQAGSQVVEEQYARQAWDSFDQQTTVRRIQDILTREQKIVLAVITLLENQDRTPATFKDVFGEYEAILSNMDEDSRHDDRVRDYLQILSMYGFIAQREENSGMAGGRRFIYSLDIDIEHAVEGVSSHDVAAEIVYN
jgi:cell division control protein 6